MEYPTIRYSGDAGVKIATLMACEIVTWGKRVLSWNLAILDYWIPSSSIARSVRSVGVILYVRIAVSVAYFPLLISLTGRTWDSVQGIRNSRPRQAMLAAILIMFSCSSVATMFDMHRHWIPFVRDLAEDYDSSIPRPMLSPLLQWWILQRINVSSSCTVSNALASQTIKAYTKWPNRHVEMLVSLESPSASKVALVWWHFCPVRCVPLLAPSPNSSNSSFASEVFFAIDTTIAIGIAISHAISHIKSPPSYGEDTLAGFGVSGSNNIASLMPFPLINNVATGFMGYKAWYAYT